MSATWNTKWGSRRVRHDPPTLSEAIAAAQGLSDDPQAQVQIAAGLMGVTVAEAKAELQKLAPDRRATRLVAAPARDKGTRTVVVERKASRRVLAKDLAARDLAARDLAKEPAGREPGDNNLPTKDLPVKAGPIRLPPRSTNLMRR